MRKICVVTGTRAEYGVMKPVLEAIKKKSDLKLSIIATGMHLSQEFGLSYREIERDGFIISSKVDMLLSSDNTGGMAKSLGIGIIGITQAIEQIDPDIVLVWGDRIEALAGAIAGAYLNIPVAHIHGGDSAAGFHIDDSNRHAITKFSHLHFPATKKSAERIAMLGEEAWRIHMVGSPAIDIIKQENFLSRKDLVEKYHIDVSKPLILLIQHPVSAEFQDAALQMRETLEAIAMLGYQTIIIYPNADAGGRKMIEVIKEYESYKFIKTFKNLPRSEYLGMLRIASVIVGNSSSGIVEAPSFQLPAVNIGSRQHDRENAGNTIDVRYNQNDIKDAINKAINDNGFRNKVSKCKSPYGDGKASERIALILEKIEINKKLMQKKFHVKY